MAPKKPRVTSSSNRSKRSTKKPITKGQNPQRARRQKVSQAQVSSSTTRSSKSKLPGLNQDSRLPGAGRVTGTTGRPKPANPPKVTTGSGRSAMDVAKARGKAEVRKAVARRGAVAANRRMARKLAVSGAKRLLGGASKLAGRGALFYEGIKADNTATGTLEEAKKKYGAKAMPQKQGPAAPKTTQSSFNKKSFNDAFRTARKSGAKTFTWRGKKYTTEMK